MATSKKTPNKKAKRDTSAARARPTVSGPSDPPASAAMSADDLESKMAATAELVEAVPFNRLKPSEFDPDAALAPMQGDSVEPSDHAATGSTLTESNGSDKVGSGAPPIGVNKTIAPLDNQNSLKAGLRGPTLLEDFVLREKITHFDHERIPERIVHARGSAAHGVFECYARPIPLCSEGSAT